MRKGQDIFVLFCDEVGESAVASSELCFSMFSLLTASILASSGKGPDAVGTAVE